MSDLRIRNARLAGREGLHEIRIEAGRIAAVVPAGTPGPQWPELDAQGHLVSPPFVDAHFHMDATLSYGMPRINSSGTLLEGIALWGELKPVLTREALVGRALAYCDWAVAKGLLAIRSHVDVCDPRLLAVQALLEVRDRVREHVDLQLVAFPQDGLLRAPGALDLLERALDMGVDVIGGIPHFERTMDEGAQSLRILTDLAARRGLRVDIHCDESDDPMSRHIETLVMHAQRTGLGDRVTASHLTSMHSMDNTYASKLIALIAESRINVIANPLVNITLQGRHDTYPKRRGMTRVPELMQAGVNVGFGHDCVMDPWYPMGSGDMLEVAMMGLHVAQMTGHDQMLACFDAVTTNSARTLGLEGYGLDPGCHGDVVVLQARDPVEALRLRATRLHVVRRGRLLASTPAAQARLNLPGRPDTTDWLHSPV